MPLGKPSKYYVLSLTREAQINGTGSEADIAAPHVRIPVKSWLVRVYGSAQAIASGKSTVVHIYRGANKTAGTKVLNSTGIALSNTTLTYDATANIKPSEQDLFTAGTELCLSETSSSSANIIGLSVQLLLAAVET